MPVLKARVNDQWVTLSGGAQEVAVGDTDPLITDPSTLLWFNTTNEQLLAQVNKGRWQQVIQGANEVIIGPLDPSTLQPGAELWLDTNANPPELRAWMSGEWKPVFSAPASGSEVEITPDDPLIADPASSAELWLDTSTDPPVLKGYVNGAWEPITSPPSVEANEVTIGGVDPGFDLSTELWLDTSVDPHVLNARVDGTWVPVTSATETLPPGGLPNQVLAKASNLDYQVSWQDIPRELPAVGTPGQVLTKTGPVNPLGVAWSDAAAGGGTDEVLIAPDDPYVADPAATIELWYDSDEVPVPTEGEVAVNPDEPTDPGVELWYDEDATPVLPTSGMRAFWNPAVQYAPGDQVLWPEQGADIHMARRPTVGEPPSSHDPLNVIDAIDFNPAAALPQGLSAVTSPLYSGGLDLRVYFRQADSMSLGTIVAGTNAANIAVFRFEFQDPLVAGDPSRWLFSVLDNTAVPVTLEVPNTAYLGTDIITHPFVRLVADMTNQTLAMFKSADGVDWIQVGTTFTSPNPWLLTGVTAVHIGHDNDDPAQNWENVLCAVETVNYGSVRQTSWVARTQPDVANGKGIGVSPLTGEEYTNVNVCPLTTMTDQTTPWANVTNLVQYEENGDVIIPDGDLILENGQVIATAAAGTSSITSPSGNVTIQAGSISVLRDGDGLYLNGNGGIIKRSGGGIVIREHSGGQQPKIENSDGGGGRDILDTVNGYTRADADAAFLSQSEADGRYANIAGDTFTGQLNATAPVVITGSDSTNSRHFYVDASSNNDNYTFTALEGRRLDIKQVFKILGMIESLPSGAAMPDARLKFEIANGSYGLKEFAYGEAESQGAASLNCWNFYNLNFVVRSVAEQKQNVQPLDPARAGTLIDAINPITFDRLQPQGQDAVLESPPTHHVGFTVEDVETADITGLVHGDGEKRGWSLDGMMAVAISEIKALRARVAELEAR